MAFTNEQKLLQTVINKAWEDQSFKKSLIDNPVEAIENLIGERLQLPNDKKIIVRDQTDNSIVYINIPSEPNLEDLELDEKQLEAVAGGSLPFQLIPNVLELIRKGDETNS